MKAQYLLESVVSSWPISGSASCACILDMLERRELLAEARQLANSNFQGAKVLKGNSSEDIMLGACSINTDVEFAKQIGEDLMTLELEEEMSYVSLSNLYCASGQWKNAEMVRKTMVDQGVRKTPGSIWIEIGNDTTSFVAGDYSHPYMIHGQDM